MQQLEVRNGLDTPFLVHSDLELIDQAGKPLGFNFLEQQCTNPQHTAPVDLALTNVVTGCTVLLNRPLQERSLSIPPQAVMHDWWLALVASVFGRMESLPKATVCYLQHR